MCLFFVVVSSLILFFILLLSCAVACKLPVRNQQSTFLSYTYTKTDAHWAFFTWSRDAMRPGEAASLREAPSPRSYLTSHASRLQDAFSQWRHSCCAVIIAALLKRNINSSLMFGSQSDTDGRVSPVGSKRDDSAKANGCSPSHFRLKSIPTKG